VEDVVAAALAEAVAMKVAGALEDLAEGVPGAAGLTSEKIVASC
jgi:hypothetical protein